MSTRRVLSIIVCFIAAFGAAASFAEAPDTLWMRAYGGTESDGAHSVQRLSEGGYIVTGYTNSYGGTEDVYLVRTDADGNSIWIRGYGGSGDERGRCVRETPDGGFIIAGYTDPDGTAKHDIYVLKTDEGGTLLWANTYGGADDDVSYSVECTSDGGYIIVGSSYSFGPGLYDVYLIKLSSAGDSLWTRTYGGSDHDGGLCVRQTTDGGYIIVGRTHSYSIGENDIWLIKVDSLGNMAWDETYGSSWDDYAYSIDVTHDGGYVITGTTKLLSGAYNDIYVVRTDSLGQLLWSRSYGGPDTESGNSVREVDDGQYLVAGWTRSFGAGLYDLYLLKLDDQGDTVWTATYGGPETDAGYCLEESGDGAYIIAGWTSSYGAGNSDLWLVKTQPDLASVASGNHPRSAQITMIVKPNPCLEEANLTWNLPTHSRVRIAVYNPLGQEVDEVVNREFFPGQHQAFWDGSNSSGHRVPAGVYFLQLQAGGELVTRKIVIEG